MNDGVIATKLFALEKQIEELKKENKHLSKSYAEAILFNQKRCEQNKELKEENAKLKKKNKDLKEYNWKLKNQYQLLEIQKNCAEQKNERLETQLNAYNELEKWLNENIVRIVKLQSPKSGVKPYGEEYNYYQNYIVAYKEVLIKINEIRGKK